MREESQLESLRTIERVAAKTAPGRPPLFTEAHILKALDDINLKQPIGRMKLSRDLQLGEGEARTLIKHLKNERLIDVSKSGISLSATGRAILRDLRTLLSEQVDIPSTSLTVDSFNVAVRVTGLRNSVKYGLEQRDAAILAGAKGATTLIFTENGLSLPGTGETISRTDSSLLAALSKLSLKEGDVIIIGSADARIKAELGAKTAALELLKTKNRRNIDTRCPHD
jgi:predicted transcriptional regulator